MRAIGCFMGGFWYGAQTVKRMTATLVTSSAIALHARKMEAWQTAGNKVTESRLHGGMCAGCRQAMSTHREATERVSTHGEGLQQPCTTAPGCLSQHIESQVKGSGYPS